MGGLSLPQILAAEKAAPKTAKSGGLGHKAVIMVYLPGGPTHHDMTDLKPDAPSDIRSPFKPIGTSHSSVTPEGPVAGLKTTIHPAVGQRWDL